jgi:hypothetical protein
MRRSEIYFNIFLTLGLPLLAVAVACVFPFLTNAPGHLLIILLFWAVGFLMFLKAKLSLITRGKLFSFGLQEMSRINRIFYVFGYILMGVGLFLSLAILVFYR